MKAVSKSDLFRKLPSVDELTHSTALAGVRSQEGEAAVTDAVRLVLARLREEIASGRLDETGVDLATSGLTEAVERQLRESLTYSLRPVINATGVLLHTNLGRAPLAETALKHIRDTATHYSNLEFNINTGERGKRDIHIDRLFQKLLTEPLTASADPAREISTIIVNNNAAAVLLALNSIAEGGEVIVSRGELVEIGGSFRIPDVMTKSHAILREVGTTNRTRITDYAKAITEKTRLLLRVHRSNFAITGFTEQPRLEQLVELGRKHTIPVMEDLGSGALFDLRSIGVTGEPGVLDSLRAGVDVVTYSGDKLLGGPQAGIISGRHDLVHRMRSNSLFRALRVDKLIYAALEATLLAYVKRDYTAIPALHMMTMSKDEIAKRARAIAEKISQADLDLQLADSDSVIGGGAAPTATLPTRVLTLTSKRHTADELAARLRHCEPPIIARVEDGRVLLDLRTVFPEQDEQITSALRKLATPDSQT